MTDLPGMSSSAIKRDAIFDPTKKYRYSLMRVWDSGQLGKIVWIMLNPSTADDKIDDPTIRRCMGFSRRWGYRIMEITNIFALRSTDPKLLYTDEDPVGPANDDYIRAACHSAALVMCAWGTHGDLRDRGRYVSHSLLGLQPLHCLGTTGGGFPRHPLYVRADQQWVEFPRAR